MDYELVHYSPQMNTDFGVDANQKMIFISFIRVYLWLKGVNRYSR
jgi:hypothetical protein